MSHFFENEAQSFRSEPQPSSNNYHAANILIENQQYEHFISQVQSHSGVITGGDEEMLKGLDIYDFLQDD